MPKKRQNRIGTVISSSGITSLAPRVYLRNRDNASGSYPTIARTGDTRSGVYSSSFDDTSSVFIGASDNLILGSQILSSSQYISDFAASPSTNPSLVGPGTASFGVSDQRIAYRNPGQDLAPFSEHHLFACDPGNFIDPFYLTGSRVEDVGPGFSLPLKEKTKIEIDLSPSEEISFGPDGSDISPMVYYDWGDHRWEKVGRSVNILDSSQLYVDRGMFGFSPGLSNGTGVTGFLKITASPCNNFGFPSHPKFHATSSQLFSLANKIQQPFLVEKMVYEFSGSYDTNAGEDAAVNTFFILNQRNPFRESISIVTEEITGGTSLSLPITIPTSSYSLNGSTVTDFIDTTRDLVTFSQVSSYLASAAPNISLLSRDLNIESSTAQPSFPGAKYILSSSIRTPKLGKFNAWKDGSGNLYQTENLLGGRAMVGKSSGRGLVKEFTAQTISGSVEEDGNSIKVPVDVSEESPYLLFPDDNLVFGWQVAYARGIASDTSTLTLSPGHGKLVLYGSLVRDQKEFHQGTNQLLTSDSVHEDIRDNTTLTNTSDCLDQLLSEYTSQYSGSYIDNVFDEDLGIGLSRIGTKPNSIIAGQAGTTGSLLRGVSLLDSSERFYDSVVPDIFSIFTTDGATIPIDTGGSNKAILAFGETPFAAADSNSKNDKWFRSFPFESRYANVPRMLDSPTKTSPTATDSAGSIPGHAGQLVAVVFTDFPTSVGGGNGYWCDSNLSVGNESAKQRAKIIYGIGQGISGSVLPTRTDHSTYSPPNSELVAPPVYRGFKYGLLNAVPQFTKAIFRYDRYGQFRDMLEQRLFAKFAMSGDESREVVSILFSRVFNTGDGNLVRRQFTPEDASGHINIDPHSRVTKPFFDVSPENITKNTDVDSLQVANINSLAGGSDIDPKNLGLNDFTSFVKG